MDIFFICSFEPLKRGFYLFYPFYSMKMRAVFRYRRLPHIFEIRTGTVREETNQVRPQIVPMVRGPEDESWMVDSTPIVYELEDRHENGRSILPDNPGDRFLAELIEDFADEWLTKAMFHYRWYYATDRDFGAFWIATDQVTDADASTRRTFADQISERQVSRMPLVGCTDENKPVIERSYESVLDALESHVGFGRYLFGTRPSIGHRPNYRAGAGSPRICRVARNVSSPRPSSLKPSNSDTHQSQGRGYEGFFYYQWA